MQVLGSRDDTPSAWYFLQGLSFLIVCLSPTYDFTRDF